MFANGPEMWAPTVFGNRDKSRSALLKALSDPKPGTVVEIVDHIGTGKSFLVDTFYTEFEQHRRGGGREGVPKFVVTPRNAKGGLEALRKMSGYEFIVFDEVDSKTAPGVTRNTMGLRDTLRLANDVLGSPFTSLIVVGDWALDNAQLWERLPNCQTRTRMPMEPLDEEFFLLAMALRLKRYMPQVASAADPNELREVARQLFEAELLECLLPHTDTPVATFRSVLWIAGKLAGELESSTAPCVIAGDHARSWFRLEPIWFDSDGQEEFARGLFRLVRDRRSPSAPFKSLSLEELRDACPVKGIGDNQTYLSNIIIPMINANLLMYTGIPYAGGEHYAHRFAGPYLPTPLSFLHAVFDGIPV